MRSCTCTAVSWSNWPSTFDFALGILQPLGHDIDAEIGAVRRQRRAVAVEDPAPPRRDQGEVHPVRFREHLVFFVLGDGEIAHPRGEQEADPALDAADQEAAALERMFECSGGVLAHRCVNRRP